MKAKRTIVKTIINAKGVFKLIGTFLVFGLVGLIGVAFGWLVGLVGQVCKLLGGALFIIGLVANASLAVRLVEKLVEKLIENKQQETTLRKAKLFT